MKPRKIPMRMCALTREKLPKQELIRVVCFENIVSVDVTGKANGKGCYLKKDVSVIEKARSKKLLNSVFDTDVDEKIYDEIINKI